MNGLLSALCSVECNYVDWEAVGCSDSFVVMEIIVKKIPCSEFYFSERNSISIMKQLPIALEPVLSFCCSIFPAFTTFTSNLQYVVVSKCYHIVHQLLH